MLIFFIPTFGCNDSETLEICCASCPDYGPLSIKISSDSEKRFPSYCRWKFELISQGIVNRVNSSRVIAIRSWAEKNGDFCLPYLQFPVRLTQTSYGNNLGTICPNHL